MTETPWSESEFENELVQKLGSNWEQQLEHKWGNDWRESCEQELVYNLGDDWADHPHTVAEKLAELVAEAPAEEPEWKAEEQPQHDPDEPLSIDLSEYDWLSTVAEANSLHSWLVRVGVSGDLVGALTDEGAGASPSGSDPDQPLSIDLSEYEWLGTVAEADSLRSWLVRVGVPDELVGALAEAAG